MFESFLLKYIASDGIVRHTPVDENNDVFKLAGIRLGGSFVFDETNIVTVSGVNSLQSVSGDLEDLILSVSGASSLRDDLQDLDLISVSGDLEDLILSVSGASSLRDDLQDLDLISVSGDLEDLILSVSGASSLRDDSQDLDLVSVSGNLQGQIDAITSDVANEERFAASGGQTAFDTSFTFDASASIRDLVVYRNGTRVFQSLTGDLPGVVSGGDYVKNSESQIEFLYPLTDGDRVIIRDERTGGSGGGVDLENITVDPQPLINAGQSLGTSLKAWESLFLKDTTNSDIYEIQIVSGALQATLV